MLLESHPLEVTVSHHTCEFHQQRPNVPYAGCTCTSTTGAAR